MEIIGGLLSNELLKGVGILVIIMVTMFIVLILVFKRRIYVGGLLGIMLARFFPNVFINKIPLTLEEVIKLKADKGKLHVDDDYIKNLRELREKLSKHLKSH